jgi:hypothetical protein
MKATKIMKRIVETPFYAAYAAGYGVTEVVLDSVAYVTGNERVTEAAGISKNMRLSCIDLMTGKEVI